MANPAPTINQINAFNATQGTTIDFNIIGGTELVRSNRIYIYDLSDNSLICTHLYISTESIHELPANTDSSIVYESGKSSADFVNGAQYYAQIQTYTDTAGTQGGSGLSVAKMFWCLVDPTLTTTTIPSTISTTSYNVSATYNANTSVVSNIIQQYQFSLYSATGSLLQSSGVVVGSGEQQGTSTTYDISYNFTGLSVGSSYYVVIDVTTTQGMSVTTQSGTFTVSIDTPTLGEATVVNNACDGYISVTSNLSGEYGGSASGEIASFVTDSVNDVSSLKVDLDPIQDLNGYDAPWVGGAGKNKLDISGASGSTINGITWTVNNNGTITTSNNTATSNSIFYINFTGQVPAGNYYFNGCPSGGSNTKYDVFIWDNTTGARAKQWDGTTAVVSDFGSNNNNQVQILSGHDYTFNCRVVSGQSGNGLVFKPMLRLSTEADGTFAPYENICPISGHTEVGVSVVGKNLLENNVTSQTVTGTFTITRNSDGSLTLNGTLTEAMILIGNLATNVVGAPSAQNDGKKHIPNGTWRVSTHNSNAKIRLQIIGSNNPSGISGLYSYGVLTNSNVTIDDSYAYNWVRLNVQSGTFSNETIYPTIAPTSDYSYEPYIGQSYTTPLGRTVYGGTLDLISGELTVTHAKFKLSDCANGSYISGSQVFGFQFNSLNINTNRTATGVQGCISDTFANYYTGNSISLGSIPNGSFCVNLTAMSSGNSTITLKDTNYTTATDILNAYGNTVFVVPLTTPKTYQLTPQQIQTLIGQNNVWSEAGDVEVTYNIPITNLLVKRQDVDDVSGDWLTLYSQPVLQASDMDFTFIDFTNQYGKTYKYALVPLLNQTQSGVEVEVEGGYTVSDEVQSVFDGVFIADSTGSQKCKANVGYGNVDMNQVVGSITPIGAKYPIIITNSKNQYHNGSISGTIVPDDYYFNGNLSRIDMVNKRDELEQFLTNKRAKIIKDWNSNIWLVMIMDNVSCTFNNSYGMGIVNFSTSWVEVGDPTNQQDLQATGLINVGGV